MKIDIKTDVTAEEFRKATGGLNGGFLQTPEWGDFKSRHGWEPGLAAFYYGDKPAGGGLYLRRHIPGGFFLYFPKGPFMDMSRKDMVSGILKALPGAFCGGKDETPLFIRIEPDMEEEKDTEGLFSALGYKKAPYDIQYRNTRLVPLADEETLWAGFTSKQRNKIRSAPKKDVEIRSLEPRELREWYDIYKETAARNNIFIHPYGYYEDFYTTFVAAGKLTVTGAFYRGTLLAGAFIVHHNGESIYMFSGSGNRERNRRPNEAIQWEALKEAVSRGSKSYDMWGVAPPGAKNHPWAGLSEFKAGFGGRVVTYCGTYDYPCRPVKYRAIIMAEKARNSLLALKKALRGR